VCLTRIATRQFKASSLPGGKRPLKDKHYLFRDYDPENTLLNGVK